VGSTQTSVEYGSAKEAATKKSSPFILDIKLLQAGTAVEIHNEIRNTFFNIFVHFLRKGPFLGSKKVRSLLYKVRNFLLKKVNMGIKR
jgi:hypothetical protein